VIRENFIDFYHMVEILRRASEGQHIEMLQLLRDRKQDRTRDRKKASNPQGKVLDTTFDLVSTSVGLAKQPYDKNYHLPDSLGLFRTPILLS
jgi:hypothetical protein